jgi:hypothetical protein
MLFKAVFLPIFLHTLTITVQGDKHNGAVYPHFTDGRTMLTF